MADVMTYPERLEDFLKSYSFRDEKEVYTNGAELIPLFRVKQGLGHYYKPVVHAQWYETKERTWCSHCREEALFVPSDTWGADEIYYLSDYCPHCGAVMDGEAESES